MITKIVFLFFLSILLNSMILREPAYTVVTSASSANFDFMADQPRYSVNKNKWITNLNNILDHIHLRNYLFMTIDILLYVNEYKFFNTFA